MKIQDGTESVVVLSHSVIDGAAWRLNKRKALQVSEKRVHVDRPDRSEGEGLRGPPWRADAQRTLDEGVVRDTQTIINECRINYIVGVAVRVLSRGCALCCVLVDRRADGNRQTL